MAHRYPPFQAHHSLLTSELDRPVRPLPQLLSGWPATNCRYSPATRPALSRRLLLVWLLIVLTGGLTRAQQQSGNAVRTNPYGQVSIASPTAASLGKYVDIPVNYHTGIADVSIPLYTVQEGPLAMPLSLSYHGGGVKVAEPAGWVGTSWALNAGGVITRSVVDKPDENGTTTEQYGHFSNYGYTSYWTIGGNAGLYTFNQNIRSPYDFGFSHGMYDGEPDLYFFNFNGYSGKFFFSDDRTPVVVDGQDLKIEYYYPTDTDPTRVQSMADRNIQGFIITVPTGDKYYFGGTDAASMGQGVETTHTSAEDNAVVDNVFSSYYLTKVVAADGVHAITLTYTPERYSYYTLSQSPIQGGADTYLGQYQHEFALVKNNLDGLRLTSITTSTGKVQFNPTGVARTDLGEYLSGSLLDDNVNTQAQALGSIAISAGDFCKQYQFSYGYFGGDTVRLARGIQITNALTTDKTRLRLDKVQESACDGSAQLNPWVFTYNSNFLPRRLSLAQDHWGFYNGQYNNNRLNTLIPNYYGDAERSVPLYKTGANRDSYFPAVGSGTLARVTYPTGGSDSLIYEPNDVWVSYYGHVYKQVTTVSFGFYTNRQTTEIPFTIPFSGNAYRITLDYLTDPNSRYSGNASVGGESPSLGLTVNKDYSKLHDEVIIKPSPGTRAYNLVANINRDQTTDVATVNVQESVPTLIEANVLAGGVRIKSITSQAGGTAPPMVKSYSYRDDNGHSTATLFSRPRYVQDVRNDILARFGFDPLVSDPHKSPYGCVDADFSGTQVYQISPSGTVPLSTTQGNHLGYDQVRVTQSGQGHTDYYYYSTQSVNSSGSQKPPINDVCIRYLDTSTCDPTAPNLPAAPARYEFQRGQLKFQRVFNEQGEFIKDAQYTYAYDSSRMATPAYISRLVSDYGLSNTYERRAYWKKRMQVIETDMAAGQGWRSTTVTMFASPTHRQPTQVTHYLPNGDSLSTRSTYVLDLAAPACQALADGTAIYQQRCDSCDAVLRQNQVNVKTDKDEQKYTMENWLCRASAARQHYISYRRQNFTNPGNTYQATHDQAKQQASAPLAALLQLQDANHNEVVESSEWRNGHLLSAAYTQFGPDLGLPGVMHPQKEFALLLAVPSSSFTPVTVNATALGVDARYATQPEATIQYDQGNLVQVRPRTGILTAYLWGYRNTLPIAKATGVSYAALRAAYQQRGTLPALYQAPTLARGLLTTYAQRPWVGPVSQTDPTGRPTTYEYDALGRLVRTRNEQGQILSQQQYHYARP